MDNFINLKYPEEDYSRKSKHFGQNMSEEKLEQDKEAVHGGFLGFEGRNTLLILERAINFRQKPTGSGKESGIGGENQKFNFRALFDCQMK